MILEKKNKTTFDLRRNSSLTNDAVRVLTSREEEEERESKGERERKIPEVRSVPAICLLFLQGFKDQFIFPDILPSY